MSDEIIDLSDYLAGRSERRAFAVAGGEGERSRLALPVWRAVFILNGERGGVVWTGPEGGASRFFFVLDLASNPPRTGFSRDGADRLRGSEPPAVDVADGAVTVLLARDGGRSWYLVVAGPEVGASEPTAKDREDLLFLSGECAGLLLHRNLADP